MERNSSELSKTRENVCYLQQRERKLLIQEKRVCQLHSTVKGILKNGFFDGQSKEL